MEWMGMDRMDGVDGNGWSGGKQMEHKGRDGAEREKWRAWGKMKSMGEDVEHGERWREWGKMGRMGGCNGEERGRLTERTESGRTDEFRR